MRQIPFCRPYLTTSEKNMVLRTLENRWITTGPVTEAAETALAEYLGAKRVVLVSSCTAALQLSLEYYKQKYGKKKFSAYVPALTFAATATEAVHAGADLTFGDVGEDMLLSAPAEDKYDVYIPVHLTGNKITTKFDGFTIEDSAHLIERNQMAGNKNLVCFSFYATKNLAMGEGGAIATNDDEAADWFKKARHHGISKDGWKRLEKDGNWLYDIEFIGWKANPSDIASSLLLAQLDNADKIHKERQRVVDLYNMFLGLNNTGLHLYPVLVEKRDEFIKIMKAAGIQCSVHFQPLHQMTAFKYLKSKNLKNTEFFGDRLVSLPLFPELTNNDIEYVCKTIKATNLLLPRES